MALRTIQAPGIQVNEIDRSQYGNKVDYSLPNSPYCFIAGFADKGDDYTIYSIPTREALIDKYGQPQNEAERYFYNGCLEVLNRGAKLLTVKLPYCNNSKDMYSYVDYKIDPNLYEILTDSQIIGKWNTVNDVREVLKTVISHNSILDILGKSVQDVSTLPAMRDIVLRIIESNKYKEIYEKYKSTDLIAKSTAIENTFVEIYIQLILTKWLSADEEIEVREQWDKLLSALSYNDIKPGSSTEKSKFTVTEVQNIVTAINNGKIISKSSGEIQLTKLKEKYILVITPGSETSYDGFPNFNESFTYIKHRVDINDSVRTLFRNAYEKLEIKTDEDKYKDYKRAQLSCGIGSIDIDNISNINLNNVVHSMLTLNHKDLQFKNEYENLITTKKYSKFNNKITIENDLIIKFNDIHDDLSFESGENVDKFNELKDRLEIVWKKYKSDIFNATTADELCSLCYLLLEVELAETDLSEVNDIFDKSTLLINTILNQFANVLKNCHIAIYNKNTITIILLKNIVNEILHSLEKTNVLRIAVEDELKKEKYKDFELDLYNATVISNEIAVMLLRDLYKDMSLNKDLNNITNNSEKLKLYDKINTWKFVLTQIGLDPNTNVNVITIQQLKYLVEKINALLPIKSQLSYDFNTLITTDPQYSSFLNDLNENASTISYDIELYFRNSFKSIFNIMNGKYSLAYSEFKTIMTELGLIDKIDQLELLSNKEMVNVILNILNKSDLSEIKKVFNLIITPINKYAGFPYFEYDLSIVNQFIPIQLVTELREAIRYIVNSLNDNHPYVDLKLNDNDITSYCNIVPDIDSATGRARSGMITTDLLDDYLTNDYTQIQNKIRIVDMTRHQYDPTSFDTVKSTLSDENGLTYSIYTNDCLGIVPVVVAPTNALYFQCLIEEAHSNDYNGIANFNSTMTTNPNVDIQISKNTILSNLYIDLKNNEGDLPTKETLSKMVADCFPLIERANPQHYDQEHFKKIGIVVLSAFIDNANNKKLNFKVLESFVGSLDKYARSTSDNSSIFIDNIVNNNSNYIKCFSAANTKTVRQASIIALKNLTATSLGFYKLDCEKNINTLKSILTPIKKILEIMQDPRGYQIDMIIDAGLTNIGQYLEGVNKKYSKLIDLNERPSLWYAIASIFDNFCKFVRKDCIYLLDCPRPFCLEGEQKIVRRTKPTNTILNNIIPKLKYMTGMNSSYTVGYCNWFKCIDDFTKDVYWCPPSIKAAGIYCYTDVYFHKWDAPAGMNRGKVIDVLDTAFNPTNDEAGRLYTQCWNYAVNYPVDGIVIEGQRTFQRKATALDRVNVRRLMIHLEKETVNIAKYYLYEGHTSYLREKFVNALTPIFENAVNGYGISYYIIKCDAENNPTIAIERNELHCSIAVKPIKAVEFIVLNFIVTNQSASVSEEVSR